MIEDISSIIQKKIEKFINIPSKIIFGDALGSIIAFIVSLIIMLFVISIPFIILILIGNK